MLVLECTKIIYKHKLITGINVEKFYRTEIQLNIHQVSLENYFHVSLIFKQVTFNKNDNLFTVYLQTKKNDSKSPLIQFFYVSLYSVLKLSKNNITQTTKI